jgi:hypothetical protein
MGGEKERNGESISVYFVHVDEVTHLFCLRGPALLSRRKLSRGIEEGAAMDIPEDPLKRKKRIMDLARVRSGEPEDRRNFLGPTYRQMSSILLNSFPPLDSIQYNTCRLNGCPSNYPQSLKSVRRP